MSFSLIGPFSFGAKVTSAQFNQLDTDHSNSLDKSTAGDSLAGAITMLNTASIAAGFANNITAGASGAIRPLVAGGILSNFVAGGIRSSIAAGIQSTVAGGIRPTVPGGIDDGGQVGGIIATVAGGISDGGVAGGIAPTVAGGIGDGGVAGGIRPRVAGGITTSPSLSTTSTIVLGGNLEHIGFFTSRQFTRKVPLGMPGGYAMTLGSGWTNGCSLGAGITGLATGAVFLMTLSSIFNGQFNGATLTAASIDFFVHGTHTSLPANPPSVTIIQQTGCNTSGLVGNTTLFTGSPSNASSGTAAGWDASGAMQTFAIPRIGAAQQIDRSTYDYVLQIVDENGANSVSGNGYITLNLTFSSIANAAPY